MEHLEPLDNSDIVSYKKCTASRDAAVPQMETTPMGIVSRMRGGSGTELLDRACAALEAHRAERRKANDRTQREIAAATTALASANQARIVAFEAGESDEVIDAADVVVRHKENAVQRGRLAGEANTKRDAGTDEALLREVALQANAILVKRAERLADAMDVAANAYADYLEPRATLLKYGLPDAAQWENPPALVVDLGAQSAEGMRVNSMVDRFRSRSMVLKQRLAENGGVL